MRSLLRYASRRTRPRTLVVVVLLVLSAAAVPATAATLPDDLPMYATVHSRWNDATGAYSNDARVNALMLQLHVRAVQGDAPRSFVEPARVARLVDLLTRRPAFIDGATTAYTNKDASQAHVPGFTSSAIASADAPFQHVAVNPVIALALAEAAHAAAAIGLPADLRDRARKAVLRVAASPVFAPDQIRMGQFSWTADMLWAKYLVDGDRAAFVRAYRRTLDSERKLFPVMLTKDSSYRYSVNNPRKRANKMDSPEYSFITFMGAAYLPIARQWGMRTRPGELTTYRNWAHRLVWGEYGNSGYLNWDTGLGRHRAHLTQYWGWTTLSLGRITAMLGSFLPPADRTRAASLCTRAQRFMTDTASRDDDGLLPLTTFGTISDFILPGAETLLANIRPLLGLRTCPGSRAPASAASFDPALGRYAVTTSRYTTAVTTYALDTIWGLLPNRLHDQDGSPIGGLGGKTSGFSFSGAGFSLSPHTPKGYRATLRAVAGSGPLAGRNLLRGRIVHRGRTVTTRLVFGESSFDIDVHLPRRAAGTWRIPFADGTVATSIVGAESVLAITPAHGRPWQVRVPTGAAVTFAAAAKDDRDPIVNRVAIVKMPPRTDHHLRVLVSGDGA